jgi:8-amino-7-oxononanoate synthase
MHKSITDELQKLRDQKLFRTTRCISSAQSAHVQMNGKDQLLLCSNNYLGLADHPSLIEASVVAVQRYGASSAASRLVSGTMDLHEQLEADVAGFKSTEAALLFNSGYAANTGIIPAVAGRGDVIFSDRLNHASIVDGALLSGARLIRYPHNDCAALATLMDKHAGSGRLLIVTDAVFSMDGDLAFLPELVALKLKHHALLMVDDAHGSGAMGQQGRGVANLQGVADGVDVQMGTFGKALGSFGAYAAVTQEVRDLLINRARSFIYSTSLPPAVLGASSAAIKVVRSTEGDRLRQQLSDNAALFRALLTRSGFSLPEGSTQIIPIMVGDAQTAVRFSQALFEEGIFVQAIRPPTVPAGSSRLRCTVMATHSTDDLRWAAGRISETGKLLGVI